MGQYRKLRVRLAWRHRKKLKELLRTGIQSVRVVRRALVLSQLHQGESASQVASALQLSEKAVREIGWRYNEQGLDRALYDKPRPGARPLLDSDDCQRIVAMVCSHPPEGYARWTVRLIAEEAVRRKLVPRAGRETIRILLQNHDLQPWREKNVVVRRDETSTSAHAHTPDHENERQ
jgi:putative transposase